jgi:hypothetical protein
MRTPGYPEANWSKPAAAVAAGQGDKKGNQ